MSLFVSVAVTTAPTFSPAAVFSATLRASVGFAKVGALLGVPVVPEPWSDQALGVSPLSARTCTWYSLDASSGVIVVLVPVTVPVQAVQTVAGTLRYSTS